MLFKSSFVLKAIAFVIILISQLLKEIGLRFSILVLSLPFFSSSVITDCFWVKVTCPTLRLSFQVSSSLEPSIGQYALYTLYGIPSGPGALSLHVLSAISSSFKVNGFSKLILYCIDSLLDCSLMAT